MGAHLQFVVVLPVLLLELFRVALLPTAQLAVKEARISARHDARLGNQRAVLGYHLRVTTQPLR